MLFAQVFLYQKIFFRHSAVIVLTYEDAADRTVH